MKLEPLADYLEPHFGNVYSDNVIADDGFIEYRPWDPKLADAVKHYLVHEVTNEDYTRFVDKLDCVVPDGSRDEQAAAIVKQQLPWEVATAFHWAAVEAVSTLDQLLGDREAWVDAAQQEDAAFWLDANASDNQLAELAERTDLAEQDKPGLWYWSNPVWHLTPSQLLKAWHHVAGPADSDLTDIEWELLRPVLRPRRNRYGEVARSDRQLSALRGTYNGIRYKLANNVSWSQIPRRYGGSHAIYQQHYLERKTGSFADMARLLRDVPEAIGLVTWLEWLTDDADSTG